MYLMYRIGTVAGVNALQSHDNDPAVGYPKQEKVAGQDSKHAMKW